MNLQQLKPLVNNPQMWEVLNLYLSDLEKNLISTLKTSSDIETIYRTQGGLRTIQMLQSLRDKVNAE